jgi:phage antirepressor YoqD-like protein
MDKLPKNQTMNSREIAEYAGRQHKDLLESIRNMEPAWEKISGSKFRLAEYLDEQGKRRPMYELSKSECLYVATKFNDEARAKLVMRWEKLETEKSLESNNEDVIIYRAFTIIQDRNVALKAKIDEQVKVIEEQAPKVEYVDTVLQSQSTITTTVIAKELGISAHRLNTLLHELGIMYRSGETWVLYSSYQDKGFTRTKTHVYTDARGDLRTAINTVWTEEGRMFVHKKVKEHFANRLTA